MKRLALFIASTSLIVLGACTKQAIKPAPISAAGKEAKAEAKLCKNMSEANPVIHQFPTVTAETPLQSVRQASEQAGQAVRQIQEAAPTVSNPQTMDVIGAYQRFLQSLNAVPGGRATVGESADSLGMSANQFRTSWDQLYKGLQCGA